MIYVYMGYIYIHMGYGRWQIWQIWNMFFLGMYDIHGMYEGYEWDFNGVVMGYSRNISNQIGLMGYCFNDM